MKQKFIDYFMDVAERTSQLSHAIRLKVGEDKEYMDQTAGGWLSPEEIEEQWPWSEQQLPKTEDLPWLRYKLTTKPEVLHAETNAIAKLAKSNESGVGATLFITHSPCLDCAKLIYQSGINNILYRNSYRSDDGINFLTKSGVNVTRHPVQN